MTFADKFMLTSIFAFFTLHCSYKNLGFLSSLLLAEFIKDCLILSISFQWLQIQQLLILRWVHFKAVFAFKAATLTFYTSLVFSPAGPPLGHMSVLNTQCLLVWVQHHAISANDAWKIWSFSYLSQQYPTCCRMQHVGQTRQRCCDIWLGIRSKEKTPLVNMINVVTFQGRKVIFVRLTT